MVYGPMKGLVQFVSVSRSRVTYENACDDVAALGTSSTSTWVQHRINFAFIAIYARMVVITSQLAGQTVVCLEDLQRAHGCV